MSEFSITRESDARGSFCPGPLMELIRMVKASQIGDVLAVISSDEGSKTDIPAWIKKAGHEFLGSQDVAGATRFVCRKAR